MSISFYNRQLQQETLSLKITDLQQYQQREITTIDQLYNYRLLLLSTTSKYNKILQPYHSRSLLLSTTSKYNKRQQPYNSRLLLLSTTSKYNKRLQPYHSRLLLLSTTNITTTRYLNISLTISDVNQCQQIITMLGLNTNLIVPRIRWSIISLIHQQSLNCQLLQSVVPLVKLQYTRLYYTWNCFL